MKRQIFVLALPVFALAACSESQVDETSVDPAVAELAAGTGPYLVTYADGSRTLAYSMADGTEYVSTPPGPDHATWSVTDGQACVDPPGDTEDGESNVICLTMGEIGEDGSWSVTSDNGGDPVTMRRLDKVASTPADQISAGTYLVEVAENGPALAVWAEDGNAYLGLNTQHGTWHAEDGQRCSKLDSEEAETCGAPTSEKGEDGSFSAEDAANGSFTVTML